MQLQQRLSHWLGGSLALLLSLILGLGLSNSPAQAATISVTNTNDSGPGSLRQAIADAAAGDTVSFNLSGCPCTITLTSGELVINKNLIIAGPGAQVLTVSGNRASRIFQIAAGTFDVTLANLTMTNGVSSHQGGAIYVESNGTFNLTNVAVMNSIATGSFSTGGGLDFISSEGGGNVTIVGSTFSGNSAFEGGAIHLENGNIRISNTTISGNMATGALGGGISNWQSNLTIVNSTITGNSSTGTDIYGSAGGVVNLDIANITVANSLIAGNRGVNADVGNEPGNTGRFVSLGHNLIGNNQGAETFFPAGSPNVNGDLVGTSAAPIDPRLASLADNGGPTPTHALLAGSPAMNAGNPATPGSGSPACELTDQRGYARPNRCDIGAFELNGISLDSIPPTASPTQSPAANSNGWNNSDVTVTWNWSDSDTGIDSANCTTASTSSGEGTLTLRATCNDKVGNAGSAEYTVKVDKTAPSVIVTGVSEGAGYPVGSVPPAGCSTTDALSGVATQASVTVTGGNGDGTGSFTATCSGGTDLAGNSAAPISVNYTVAALPTATPTNTPVPPTATPIDTPTNTPVPPTATPIVPATTLYATVQQVRNTLAALLPSGNSKTDQSLQKAIAKLDQGLSAAFWQVPDGNHLSSQGEKAFHRLRDAIKELRSLKAPPAAVTSAINTLAGVGRTLAEQAIAEATAAGGNAKQLAKANKELTKAQQDLAKQRLDLAFGHYEEAWETAQAALGVVLAAAESEDPAVVDDLGDIDHVHDEGDDDTADELTHSDQNAQPNLLFLPVVSR